VGDHWEGNSELMAKDYTRHGWLVKKEDLKSTVTLEKVVTLGKTECLQLSCVCICDKFVPPLPSGIAVEKSAIKISFSGKYPVVTSLGLPVEGSTDMTMTLTARGKPDPNADEIVLQMTNERSISQQATEVK
jgi:hypothetical protein